MLQKNLSGRVLFHRGDTIILRLECDGSRSGAGMLRTNIGRAEEERSELIDLTEKGRPVANRGWHDLVMRPVGGGCFEITLALLETGVFAAKCFFRPDNSDRLEWVGGENLKIKVESAESAACNTIYSAFVRQFGEKKYPAPGDAANAVAALDHAGYTVIPPSGTFRDLKKQLDFLFGELGCRILQLLPIHPVPTVYGRMGRYGSPFASLDYFAVNPGLADFDPKTTPLEQFCELVDAVHCRNGRIFLDIPVNHTGWASKLQADHPEYFVRTDNGTFVSPGAWGVVWADLCKLDYKNKQVHRLMAEVFLYWCGKGVDGFRCDAGYMLPPDAWRYIVARVRDEYPDTVFLLEGLGGPVEVQEELLGHAGLDWAYSELFQNYSRDQITHYMDYMRYCSANKGVLVDFAETHDNLRLAASGKKFSLLRCALNAFLSENGAFGFANGVEFLATERIDVHGASSLNWGASDNIIEELRRMQTVLASHPAFGGGAVVENILVGGGNVLAYLRRSAEKKVLVLANLDLDHPARVGFRSSGLPGGPLFDLYGGASVSPERGGNIASVELAPGQVCCLSPDRADLETVERLRHAPAVEPEAVVLQRARAMALTIWCFFRGQALENIDVDALVAEMRADCRSFVRRAADCSAPNVVRYRVEYDSNRMVMLPKNSLLLVEGKCDFTLRLVHGEKNLRFARGVAIEGGHYLAAVPVPRYDGASSRKLELRIKRRFGELGDELCGPLLQLSPPEKVRFKMSLSQSEILDSHLALHTNWLGGMSVVRAEWGAIQSKYDALLAANCNPAYPVDRRVMFNRCRVFVVLNDYSQELSLRLTERFTAGLDNRSEWEFTVPVGQGRAVRLCVRLETAENGNAVRLSFLRRSAQGESDLPDPEEVKLILRPDLEDRVNHELTRAYAGAETYFDTVIESRSDGFFFTPDRLRQLRVSLDHGGVFVHEPEWKYMVHLPLEQYYGLEDHTDLFSPGYLHCRLGGGETAVLFATVTAAEKKVVQSDYRWPEAPLEPYVPVRDALGRALEHYVVRRDEFYTVIAGYPWFLDWGRDTLIVLRGLIAAGMLEKSAGIIRQFAMFEKDGTIPNMIRGSDDSNRDTSDAPLWLIVGVRDYIAAVGNDDLLRERCDGKRTLYEILCSIVNHYRSGTPNGIAADPESLLVFSPSHFTWMDTNFPAGTPREGYPIEIQALFHAALRFLGQYDESYLAAAETVRASVMKLFYLPEKKRFSDCLHCSPGTPAAQAVPDDHVRSNQLLALTLGLIEDPVRRMEILDSVEELIIPGAIRSLSDRPVEYQLPIIRSGTLLNDPSHPYWGHYNGPEDTARKPAYHNGTAWVWPFPSYCEAMAVVGGEKCRKRALSLLLSLRELFDQGVPGQLPEIVDGDWPHRFGGCPAQAWSVSECYRVLRLLTGE